MSTAKCELHKISKCMERSSCMADW